MDYFHFVEGFFFGREYDNNIKMQRLYLTKRYLETYYFWKEVDFETYQDTLLKKGLRDNALNQINKTYNEWLLGSKILLKHYSANGVDALDIEDFEKIITITNPNTKDKIKTKQYTGIVPNNINF